MTRIQETFGRLKAGGISGFIPFVMGGDPDFDTCLSLVKRLPAAGADIIEIGMPFTDPMADGPAIQRAGLRALAGGQTIHRTLDLVRAFRAEDTDTPIVLMGYYNPIYRYGADRFAADAKSAGVDGAIVVDLPPEEDAEFCVPAQAAGLDFVRLATPTTRDDRLPAVVKAASGFVYYVSVAGITGAKAGTAGEVEEAVSRIRAASGLPVAVGFGVRTAEQATAMAAVADAVVVGSALVGTLEASLEEGGQAAVNRTVVLAEKLSAAIKRA